MTDEMYVGIDMLNKAFNYQKIIKIDFENSEKLSEKHKSLQTWLQWESKPQNCVDRTPATGCFGFSLQSFS
jgi:hypothetical protein